MKISVKDKSTNVVICKCGWKGQIQDANWMDEEEYGKCPECSSEDFIGFEFENEDEFDDCIDWEVDGLKARLIVYAMLAGALIFGMIPWIWGLIEEFKFIWNLIF